MLLHLDCIPCFQRQAIQAARFSGADEDTQARVLKRAMSILQKEDWRTTPPELADLIHSMVRKETGDNDPYSDAKKTSNRQALDLLKHARANISRSRNPLETAIRVAIAGNIMDFAQGASFDLKGTMETALKKHLAINSVERLRNRLSNAKTLVYITDNAGEIVFDRLLVETILESFPIREVSLAVKGSPILNDAMEEDAREAGFSKIPAVTIHHVMGGGEGPGMERTGDEFRDFMAGHDVVISKGQGNYEALSDRENIFFLLMAKCPVLAADLNVSVGDIICKG